MTSELGETEEVVGVGGGGEGGGKWLGIFAQVSIWGEVGGSEQVLTWGGRGLTWEGLKPFSLTSFVDEPQALESPADFHSIRVGSFPC